MNKASFGICLLSLISLCSCAEQTYSFTVLNKHNQPVAGVEISIGNSKATTDASGKVTLSAQGGKEITTTVLPDGYKALEGYSVSNPGEYTITLDSTLREGKIERGTSIGIGDLAYNYSFTVSEEGSAGTVNHKEITLQDMLDKSDFIALNFFFFDCSWCVAEAPHLTNAKSVYGDKVYLLGLDMVDLASKEEDLVSFKKRVGFNFDVAYDQPRLTNGFAVKSYPTTVIIDRYGFVCFYYANSFNNEQEVLDVFEKFAGEDYEPVFYKKNSFNLAD